MVRSSLQEFLVQRFAAVEDRIETACRRSGRGRDDVTLVAVTKTVSSAVATEVAGLGRLDIGESRPQELWHKAAELPTSVRWHLVGHLQRNKIERTLPLVHLIHSVDSLRLLEALENEAATRQLAVSVLLEVNASRESRKHGFSPEELPRLAVRIAALRQVRVVGLMAMAALAEDPEAARPVFASVRRLRDQLQRELGGRQELRHLSMGMSNDFEVALEEGATLIRLGTILFEGLPEVAA